MLPEPPILLDLGHLRRVRASNPNYALRATTVVPSQNSEKPIWGVSVGGKLKPSALKSK